MYIFVFSTSHQCWLVTTGMYDMLGSWQLPLLGKEQERFGFSLYTRFSCSERSPLGDAKGI